MGGGSASRAQRAAEQAERERQAQIQAATGQIDRLFDSPDRQKQYDDFAAALRSYYGEDADRQKTIADRNLKFAMARGGLTGGSAAADAGKTLGDEYTRGILEAERRAQGSVADLMSQDQQSRLNLISLAQQGLDTSSAASQAAAAMRTNIGGARARGEAEGLGDIFGATADVVKRQKESADRRRGLKESEIYSSPFSRG